MPLKKFSELTELEKNKELTALNNWQKAVLNASPYAIITTDTKGIITSVNLAAEKLLGYKAIELVGIHTPEKFHDKTETIEKAKELCLQLGEPIDPNFYTFVRLSEKVGPTRTQWTYICKNGDRIPVQLCVTPINDGDNFVTGYVGIAEDISENKKLVAKIEQQKEQMLHNAKFQALGEMANGISHEINNPLLIIAGIANSLQKKIQDGKLDSNNAILELKKISNSANRIASIVTSLKEFSKEPTEEEFKHYEFEEIFSEVLNFCKEKLKKYEIEIISNFDPQLILFCQKTQMVKVFLACIFNSIHAVEKQNKKWIKIETEKLAKTSNITITDSGQGIMAAIQDKIMQPFFTTKDQGLGTGLGLSVSKGIIESHQGSFYLDKSHTHTRFVISLPRQFEKKQKVG